MMSPVGMEFESRARCLVVERLMRWSAIVGEVGLRLK